MDNQPEPFIVYIGTYTRRESFVDGKAEGIYVYRMDPRTGALTHAATVPGTVNPSFLVVSAGKTIFTLSMSSRANMGRTGQ
jgi:6-phosphogluconolactonase